MRLTIGWVKSNLAIPVHFKVGGDKWDNIFECTGKRNEIPDERFQGCARSQENAMGGEQGPISTPYIRGDIPSEPEDADQDEEIFDIEYTSRVGRRIRIIRDTNENQPLHSDPRDPDYGTGNI